MNKRGFIFIEILAILMIVAIVGLIGLSIYQDVSYGKKTGVIIDKEYHASWVGYSTSYVNGRSINIPVTHPQRWTIRIQKDNKDLWIDVSENEYNSLNIGDCYNCEGE